MPEDVESELKAIYREAPTNRKLTLLLALCDVSDDEDGFAAVLRVTTDERKRVVLGLARDLMGKSRWTA
jgi:hypothetical protein